MLKRSLQLLPKNSWALLIILVGTVFWSLTMVKSGLHYEYGLGFWGPNGHDGVWHLALIEKLAQGSFEMPIFAGEQIRNYHIGFDLVLASVHRATNIPISVLYFQLMPPVLSLSIGILTYKFVNSWRKSEAAAAWALFFVYFGGNFGWIVELMRSGNLGGESIFWAQPAGLTLINPPFALSILILLIGLNLLLSLESRPHVGHSILLVMVFGVVLSIKAHAGILILPALIILGVFEYFRTKKSFMLKLSALTLLVSLALFLPLNSSSGSLIELKPFWFLETMMSFPDRVGWARYGEAMVNYKQGGELAKGILAYFGAFLLFIVGNFGTRIIAKLHSLKIIKTKRIDRIDLLLLLMIIGGVVASMLFVQIGTAWNTIQFFYYSLFFGSILAGVAMPHLLNSLPHKKIMTSILIIATLPTSVSILQHYLPNRPPAMLPQEELVALNFLSGIPHGTVLVMPFDRAAAGAATANPPRPLRLYESTAYVSAFSGQSVWLEDEVNLDITGYPWRARRERLLQALNSSNADFVDFVTNEEIDYIYVVEPSENFIHLSSNFDKIYDSAGVMIYQVNTTQ